MPEESVRRPLNVADLDDHFRPHPMHPRCATREGTSPRPGAPAAPPGTHSDSMYHHDGPICRVVVYRPAQPDQAAAAAEVVHFPLVKGEPLNLVGHVRRPAGRGPFPAVVLLHGCAGDWRGMDSRWGARLVEWGYVALSIDSYGPRGVQDRCQYPTTDPPNHVLDAYGALDYLAAQPFVIPDRVVVMGVSGGARIALQDV